MENDKVVAMKDEILLHGARGRMGQRISALAPKHAPKTRCTALQCDFTARNAQNNARTVVVDFTSDEGAHKATTFSTKLSCALLVGTTNLSQTTLNAIENCAQTNAVLVAPNTSHAVAVFNHLVARASALMHTNTAITLHEAHHMHKKDRPSGTARRLRDTISQHGGPYINDEHVNVTRAADIVGHHAATFTNEHDVVHLQHQALSRDAFAIGALHAACWLLDQQPGMYSIEQAFGIHVTEHHSKPSDADDR